MLGFSAFAETAFGATVAHAGVTVLVTGSGVAVSQGTPTYAIGATVVVTGSGVTVSMGTAGNENSAFNFTLYNPSATTDYMMCNFEGVNRNESGNMYFFTGGSQYETAGDVDAIRLQLDGAGVFSGFFKLYGLSGS